MKKYIPNTITLINLFCGCCAIISILSEDFITAFWWFFCGGLADYSDGMVARVLNVKSELGKELDSLADMVTFGVVPGVIVYQLLSMQIPGGAAAEGVFSLAHVGFLLPVFAGLRLARFNLDERQTSDFIGLPTPSCSLFFVGIMLIYEFDSFGIGGYLVQPQVLIPLVLLFSYLMHAEINLFSFKFKGFQYKGNEIRFIFAGVAIILLFLLREAAFSVGVLSYIIIAIFFNRFSKKRLAE